LKNKKYILFLRKKDMKKLVRILSIVIAAVCILTCCTSCGEATAPKDMKNSERGTRAVFSLDKLKSYSVTPQIDDSGIAVAINISGYEDLDYVDCQFSIDFSCLVLYDDMTEEYVTETYYISLPFSGTYTDVQYISLKKTVHNIYENEYCVSDMTGEVIRK
jgi:hypothetical protein